MHDTTTMPMLQPVRSPSLSPHLHYQMNYWLPTRWHLCCCIISDHTTGGPTSTSLTYPHYYLLLHWTSGLIVHAVLFTWVFLLTRKGLYDYWVASDSAAAIVTLYSLLVLSSHVIWHHCSIASKLSPSPVGSMSLFKVYCLISSTLVSLPKSRYLPSWTEELKYC